MLVEIKTQEVKGLERKRTSAWKYLSFSGHNQRTMGLPINLDRK